MYMKESKCIIKSLFWLAVS